MLLIRSYACNRLLKKAHLLRPIALSIVEGCAQSPRSNVLHEYASARRFLARLLAETFLNSLIPEFFNSLCKGEPNARMDSLGHPPHGSPFDRQLSGFPGPRNNPG